ncbi:tRNA modification GTPase trmE [Humitalea rosea]|uniref:tRNA modification GTPase MnmE n=2 Tax=Humitalea rosea TaxID=990373 RepID=A0A2W7IIX3_9PROT|nr:tRNA modification GTPase trmE [Humitalea rosea]
MLDRALLLWFPGPASFTGEDAAELQIHGGPAVVAAVCDALVSAGCRPAEPGEFSRRAFLNGRLDLTAAEGIADLIAAETEAQRKAALRQAEGGLGAVLAAWDRRLMKLLAHQEAAIEFADEGDVPGDLSASVVDGASALAVEIAEHLRQGERATRLREGVRIVILGAPNVGKSSLLNRLARSDAAIVTDQPGTTRDVIDVRLDLAGVPVTLSDTAGLREAADMIEAEGMRRARQRAAHADLILMMTAQGIAEDPAMQPPADVSVLHVHNKIDLAGSQEQRPHCLGVSTLTGAGIETLEAALTETVQRIAGITDAATISRPRHRAALIEARDWLREAVVAPLPELSAEALRGARRAIGRLTGHSGVDAVLDSIFRDFCIGK